MPPYEPKIDSREFELANLDRSNLERSNLEQPTGTRSGGVAGEGGTDIAIRIWSAERGAGLTWKSESMLVGMMADLVGASRGRMAEELPALMAAHFDNSRQAVVAAKRIQTAMLEFVDCRPGETIASAIVVYQPRTTGSTGLSGEMVQMELGQAKPGQILLEENIAQGLRDLPGIEFASASVMGANADGPGGLAELEWASAERLARLRESVSAVRSVDGMPVGATLIVDSPFALRGASNEAALNRIAAPLELADAGRSPSSLMDGLDLEEKPRSARTGILLGVVAVVLVGVVIAVFYRPGNVPPTVSKPIAPQEQTGAGSASQKASGAASQVEPAGQKSAESPTVPSRPVAVAPLPSAKAADNRARKKKEAVTAPEVVPEAPTEVGGLTAKDIPGLLELAKKDAGAGLYDKARGEYQTVLRLKPGDPEAVEGLRRIRIASENQDQ